jgi:hypothetical protein
VDGVLSMLCGVLQYAFQECGWLLVELNLGRQILKYLPIAVAKADNHRSPAHRSHGAPQPGPDHSVANILAAIAGFILPVV